MKKIFSIVTLFLCMTAFCTAESLTKEYEIDNLYSIELTIDTDAKSLIVNLFSVNSDVFDEIYAEDCFGSEVEEIVNEYGFSEYEQLSSSKVDNFKGKYTMISRKYNIK